MTLLHSPSPTPLSAPVAVLADDPRAFRDGLADMVTSVCVVTTEIDGARHGFTANSVTSVSMEPPLVLVCLAGTAECHDAFLAAETVAINVLAADQAEVSTVFATRGADKFAAASFVPGVTGSPVLQGATVTLEGRVHERTTAGDHTMIVVEVTGVTRGERAPLTYQGRRFHRLTTPTEE
ncbi:flavin reductase family protein [Actinotalea sp.]|uniref:flavin reductase family protein n=1 Tax=Actinotalea sp. TaxID=1872145 RepID=UPI003562E635